MKIMMKQKTTKCDKKTNYINFIMDIHVILAHVIVADNGNIK